MNGNAFKPVFFDLDDTIFDFHRSETEAIAKTFVLSGVTPSYDRIMSYSSINSRMWAMFESGLISKKDVLIRRFEILRETDGIGYFDTKEVGRIYEELLAENVYLIDGAESMLSSLYGKYPLYVMSNGGECIQKRRLDATGIRKYFDDMFVSERVGFNKPDVNFFEKSFDFLPEFDRNNAVIIGDNPSSDIAGGIAAGIHTILFSPHGISPKSSINPDITVSRISDIPKAIEALIG